MGGSILFGPKSSPTSSPSLASKESESSESHKFTTFGSSGPVGATGIFTTWSLYDKMAAKKIVATAARRPSRGTLGPLVVFITNPDPPAGPWTLSWLIL